MRIRKTTANDITHLQQLFLKVRQSTFTWMDPASFELQDFDEATEDEYILVAEQENTIIGFASVWMEDNFIHHLYVDDAFQNKGIGKALLQAIMKELNGAVQLKCLLKNERAAAFYKKHGFIEKEKGGSEEGEYILFERTHSPV